NADMHDYEVKVKWLGLETIEDSWEPLKMMREDVHRLLLQYLTARSDDGFLCAMMAAIDYKQSQRSTRP
ncbi:hypothetical protein PHYSODRAFT_448299, partial [Phytophthora sojae]